MYEGLDYKVKEIKEVYVKFTDCYCLIFCLSFVIIHHQLYKYTVIKDLQTGNSDQNLFSKS